MAFCTFSKEYTQSMYTIVENQFITKYLPLADANSIKVYLFGLYLCQNSSNAFSIDDMAKELQLSSEAVQQSFLFWEDFELVKVVSKSPFCVQFYPAHFTKGRPKKIQATQYADFSKALQSLFPDKMLSANEYTKYFTFMEENDIKPDAMLLIINYCIEIKGKNIASNYIFQVAKNWIADDIKTVSQIESKLENYKINTINMQKVLAVLQPKNPPKTKEVKLLKKWLESYTFTIETIVKVVEKQSISTFNALDTQLTKLYEKSLFDWKDIKKQLQIELDNRQLTIQLAKELGVYCQNIDTYTINFTEKWKALGYTDKNLIDLAKYAFKNNKKSFEDLQTLIDKLYALKICSSSSLLQFFKQEELDIAFLGELFALSGNSKSPTVWDREHLQQWRNWGFSNEVIQKAASLSIGKQNSMSYINAILRSWKEKNIFTLAAIEANTSVTAGKFVEETEQDLHKKIEKEYFTSREYALAQAEYYQNLADKIVGYTKLDRQIKALEIDTSKAIALQLDTVKELKQQLKSLQQERKNLLLQHNIDPNFLQPQFSCTICNDTGFDKNNNYCKCYKQKLEKLKKN